jgi:hypothetical protein
LSEQRQNPQRNPGATRRASLGAMLLLIWSLVAVQPLTAQDAVSEEQLKAAVIYNFVRFVEWPSSAFTNETTPLNVGVFANDAFVKTLEASLRDKKAHGRSFVVKKLTMPNEATGSQIVIIAAGQSSKTSQITEAVRKSPILTIGESEEVLENGIIYLFKDDKTAQLRFDINVAAAEEGKLNISSRILQLARKKKTAEGTK